MRVFETFLSWLKQDKRYVRLCKALILALLPFLCCLAASAAEGRSIGEVYLPSSEWNDELFYYKQVESIVKYGYPQGYYGFNESHGLKLSFAAWSPVLVLPWIVWGVLFGWNLMSPIICNIVLMTVAVFLFVWLTEPNRKQMGILTLLFCLYTPFVRYMLSGMPEIICISHLIVFYGMAVSYKRRESEGKLQILFAISGLLTLMRPYMLLFMLLPVYLRIKSERRKGKMLRGVVFSALYSGAVLIVYALIKHYFGAEYFHPLFFTDWITVFFTDGIRAGIHNFFGTLYWKGKGFYAHLVQGLRTGLASGAFFAGYIATMTLLLWQSIVDAIKLRRGRLDNELQKDAVEGTKKAQLLVEAHLALSFVGMLFALLLMYKLTEGSKHLLTFMAVAVFVISLMETRFYRKAVIIGVVFAYLYSYKAVDPYDYQVPYIDMARQEQVEDWRMRFEETLELTEIDVPNYDNVVIWVFDEQSEEGETMKWQLLYSLPRGFGINCCQKDFVLQNFDTLNSRYIVAQQGAQVAVRCENAGYRKLSGDDDIVLYSRR